VWLALAIALPAPAAAQWYLGSFTGGNATGPATVTVDQPGIGRHLDFHDVTFEARPLESPQYYGLRIGRHLGARFGIEVEFLHIKVISQTDRTVLVTGLEGGVVVNTSQPMNRIVQHHAMTHGLNFWMANLVWRRPLRGAAVARPVTLVLRAGAGPVVPGVDSIVDGVSVQEYQFAGFGGQLAAGLDVQVFRRWSATVEYKFTRSRPVLDITGGTARMTAVSHHVAAGFAFAFAR
jgi:hypothetical protein